MAADITVRYAEEPDLPYLQANDELITEELLRRKLSAREILVALQGDEPVGWLRFGLWWDNFPCMNLIAVEDEHQRQGIGKRLVEYWEGEMRAQGYRLVLTSTDADGSAQHFHRKLGFRDAGCLLLPDAVFPEHTLEILLVKVLPSSESED